LAIDDESNKDYNVDEVDSYLRDDKMDRLD
jgi:hypothetical protein